ncbi:MAG: DUF4347 domain-containing protein [Planctomycetia bacterium]|nr:DUF4347 domain-containing protein [Planctomycetia bacterium]
MKFPNFTWPWKRRDAEPQKVRRRALQLTELEERVLYSAAPASGVDVLPAPDADAGHAQHEADAHPFGIDPGVFPLIVADLQHHADAVAPPSAKDLHHNLHDGDAAPLSLIEPASFVATGHVKHELVFVDADIEHHTQLLEALRELNDPLRELEIVVLSPDQDGVQQITAALAQHHDLDTVHVLSHSTDGALKLGATWLSSGNLNAYAGEIAHWHDALTSNADLILYGCDLTADAKGQLLIDSLHALTGADIAASTDVTGSALLGGNWNLEATAGQVETAPLFQDASPANWDGLLTDDSSAITSSNGNSGLVVDPLSMIQIHVRHELVFVDTQVANYQPLVDDLLSHHDASRQIELVYLDPTRDGVQQITDVLSQHHDLDAVHLVSHGEDGALKLGGTWLTSATLTADAAQIASWGSALTSDGDLLVYGCELAAHAEGQKIVDLLATLTGADVAASTNNTGNALLGGDWNLEYRHGGIESSLAFSADLQQNWFGMMSVVVDAVSTGSTTGTSITISHTTTSASDREMVVGVSIRETGATAVSSMTYDGVSLTFKGSVLSAGAKVEIWSLVAPNAGTHNLVVNLNNAGGGTNVGVMTFTGVDQTTPLGAFGSASGDATSGSATVSSATGDLVFGAVAVKDINQDLIPGGSQTERWDLFTGTEANGGGSTASGAASVNMSWTWTAGTNWVIGGVSVHQFVNVAPTATNLSAAESYTEDTALNLIDIVASNIDSANVTATLTLSNTSAGSLNTGTSGAVTSTYNAGTGLWSASGATADVNTLLAGLTFTPTANFNSNFTIATSISDGSLSVSGTKNFTGISVNDAPTATNLSAVESYTEDTALNLIDIVASDSDSASVTATLTLSNTAAGSLNTGTSGAVTSTYNAATGLWSASGATANVNTLLAGLTFTPTANFNSNFTIATSVSDGSLSATGTKNFTGTAVNDAPILDSSKSPALTTQNEDSGAPSGAVGTLVSSLVDFATPSGQVDNVTDVDSSAVLGIAITASDTTNGTWYYTTNSGTNWNALGTVSSASARLLVADASTRLYFQPNSNYNGTLANAITFVAWDQTSGTAGGTASFSNSVIDQLNSASYSNNNGTANWTAAWVETDSNGGGASGGRIQISGGQLDIRAFQAGDSIYREANLSSATSATLSFNYTNSLGSGDTVIAQISNNGGSSYTNLSGGTFSTSANTGSGTASFDITSSIASNTQLRFYVNSISSKNDLYVDNVQISYGTASSGGTTAFSNVSDTASLVITAVNDAPTATNLSAAESYTEDTALNLIDIVASDVDSANVTATLTLSNVSAGSLNTGTSGAVTSTYNAGTGQWTASGATANVNTLLAGLTFTPTANFNSNFTIATSVSDGSLSATGTKSFTGTAVNDAPTATNLSAAESYTEDTALNLIDIVASDIDSASVTATLTLSNTAAGSLNTGASGAVTSTYNAGTGLWSASGATADVNTLLAGLTFTPTANFNSNLSIATSVSDGSLVVTGTKIITGIAVNDAPVITSNGGTDTVAVNVAENTTSVTTVTSSDIDGGTPVYSISGGVDAAKFSIDSSTGVLTFASAPNYEAPTDSGTDNVYDVIVQVSDGTLTDTQAIAVTVTAVNEAPVITAPLAVSVNEFAVYVFSTGVGDSLVVNDVDAATLDVTITVSSGGFTLKQTTGLTFVSGDGLFDSSMRFTGNIANINAALDDAQYQHGLIHGTIESLTMLVSDLGQSGVGGILTASSITTITIVNSAVVVGDGFLQGNYLEIGMGPDGALGSDGAAPVGFNSVGGMLGAEVDNERDGWATFDGDFVTPGSPVETWGVHVGGTTYSNSNIGTPQVSGGLVNFQSLPTGQSVEWLGNQSGLAIQQIYTVGSNNLHMDLEVRLTNLSGSDLTDIYYYRNVDPDNNVDQGSPDGYTTTNTIISQGETTGISMVSATQVDGSYLGLLGFGENSRVTYGGFHNLNPLDIYNGTGGLSQTGSVYSDQAVSVAFHYDTITDGESVSLRMRYYFGSTDGALPVVDLDADNSHGTTGGNYSAAFTENGGPVAIVDTDVTVLNPSGSTLDSINVTLTNLLDGNAESLLANTSGTSITGSYNSGTGVLTLSGTDSTDHYRTVLRTLTYNNTSENPTEAARLITITAMSGTNVSEAVTATVSVTAINDAPIITSDGGGATALFTQAENIAAVTTVTSTDFDGAAAVYSLSGADAARFTINSSTGELTFVSIPNYESPNDSDTDNIYEISVTVSDGAGGSDSQAISVTVTDSNEFAVTNPTDIDNAADAVNENAANGTVVGVTGFATDADATTNGITYSLFDSAGGRFAINGSTGIVTVANGTLLDYEAATSHNITIRATSADGSIANNNFTINVNPLNDNTPTINSNGAGAPALLIVRKFSSNS